MNIIIRYVKLVITVCFRNLKYVLSKRTSRFNLTPLSYCIYATGLVIALNLNSHSFYYYSSFFLPSYFTFLALLYPSVILLFFLQILVYIFLYKIQIILVRCIITSSFVLHLAINIYFLLFVVIIIVIPPEF